MSIPERLIAALSGRYSIDREIGKGGMATVYLAEDMRHHRQVAIKVLNPDFAERIGPQRFLSEIRTTAALQHPLILPLFDSGDADGVLFYVMPYVPGGTLGGRLKNGPVFSASEAVRLIADLAGALDYAHRLGIVHRDVKPENILLHEGRALLGDFGIAFRADDAAARLTQAGFAIGTRGYMSPEQITGERVLDGRSDQYSLACVLAEMVAAARTGEETATRTLAAPPGTPPGAAAGTGRTAGAERLGRLHAEIDERLGRVIRRATSHDPQDRYRSMAEFAEELRAVEAAPSPGAVKSIAVLAFENMSGDRENDWFAEGISEEIIGALARIPELRVVARTSSFSFKGVREDLRVIGEKLRVGYVLEGSVRKAGGRLRISVQLVDIESGFQLWSERYDRSTEDVFAIQDEIATTIAGKLELTLAGGSGTALIHPRTASIAAYEEYLKGMAQVHRRGVGLLEGIESLQRAIALDESFAPALAGLSLALVLSSFWGLTDPRETGPAASDAARRARGADPGSAEAHVSSALVAICVAFDRSAAAAAWEEALRIAPNDSSVRAMRAVYHCCYVLCDTEASVRELNLALDRDPLSSVLHAHLGVVLGFGGRPGEAVAEAYRAIELDPNAMYGHWVLQQAYLSGGRYEQVVETAHATMRRFGRHGWFMMALAMAYAELGRTDRAQALYDEMLARSRTEYVQPGILAPVAMALGRREEAVELWNRAVDDRDPIMVGLLLHGIIGERIRELPAHRALLHRLGWDRPFA